MTRIGSKLAVCIPTFRRSHLLQRLLGDLAIQTRRPDSLVVVDGDPDSGAVPQILAETSLPPRCRIVYVPSNHANLPYQRYLGWKAAPDACCVLYFDDDIRLRGPDSVAELFEPLTWQRRDIVGVTAWIDFAHRARGDSETALGERFQRAGSPKPALVTRFGDARRLAPGGLSPTGQRRLPSSRGQRYERVAWLRGGAMACRRSALTADCFSEDLFALDHVRCGLGEDTFLSLRLASKGALLFAFYAGVEHPDDDPPNAYPTDGYGLGFASALSRRLLNDHYRPNAPPRLSDRLALVKSYLGNVMLSWARALLGPKPHRWQYARGYTLGALQGLLHTPAARRLTPRIDWWLDSEKALIRAVDLSARATSAP